MAQRRTDLLTFIDGFTPIQPAQFILGAHQSAALPRRKIGAGTIDVECNHGKRRTKSIHLLSAACFGRMSERGCDPLWVLQSEHARCQVKGITMLGDICRPLPRCGFCHCAFPKMYLPQEIVPSAKSGNTGNGHKMAFDHKNARVRPGVPPGPNRPGRMFADNQSNLLPISLFSHRDSGRVALGSRQQERWWGGCRW
jgi:hypothetical protein